MIERPAKRNRVRLTDKEISALRSLVAIADAGAEDEGDYQSFDYDSMRSADDKLGTMESQRRAARDMKADMYGENGND